MTRTVLYFYSHLQSDTGSPRALVSLIDALDRSRFRPLFLAHGDGPLVDEMAAHGVELLRAPVRQISPRQPWDAWRAVSAQAKVLRRARVDLVHVNEFGWNLDLVAAAAVCRIPVLLHVHNPIDVERMNLHRFVASRIVFVSEAHRAGAQNIGLLRGKTEVLHNAVDLDRLGRGRSIRDSLGIPADRLVVGTVAQVSHRKGSDIFVETARRIAAERADVHFLVVGRAADGEERFAATVMAAADDPALRGRISFVGARADVPDLLASMDVFFLPTRAEPFGIVVIEAMASGVPVVATRVGGIPEIITTPDLGVLVEPDDPAASAAALLALLADEPRRRSIGERGRASLAGRFDRSTYAAAVHRLYDEMLLR
jgi:glycosyltransferase involved in cell wall biosynthesis